MTLLVQFRRPAAVGRDQARPAQDQQRLDGQPGGIGVRFSIRIFAATLLAIGIHATAVSAPIVAITGATLVDLTNRGGSTNDIPDAVVLIEGDRIIAAGPRRSTPIPSQA